MGSSCAVVGRSLADAPPPLDARVAVVRRGDEVIIPTGRTELQPGDRAIVFGPAGPDLAAAVQAWVDQGSGAVSPPGPSPGRRG